MTEMDDALAEVIEGRGHLETALDIVEKHPDSRSEADELRGIVGQLASVRGRWERERDRWR